MKYRLATPVDCEAITLSYFKIFQNFFLSSLGVGFMWTYFRTALLYPDTVCICAINDDGLIVGFALGSYLSKDFHKKVILANKWAYFLEGMRLVFLNFRAIIRLKKNLFKADQSKVDDGLYAELGLLGVLPSWQGKGVGRQLFMEFEKNVKTCGVTKICLTTDFYDNNKAVSSYNLWGLTVWYSFIAYPNRKMYKMCKRVE